MITIWPHRLSKHENPSLMKIKIGWFSGKMAKKMAIEEQETPYSKLFRNKIKRTNGSSLAKRNAPV